MQDPDVKDPKVFIYLLKTETSITKVKDQYKSCKHGSEAHYKQNKHTQPNVCKVQKNATCGLDKAIILKYNEVMISKFIKAP